ncbi:unnamed protein product [Closterium sp. NIES-54]
MPMLGDVMPMLAHFRPTLLPMLPPMLPSTLPPTPFPFPSPAPPQVQQVAVEGEALLGGVLRASLCLCRLIPFPSLPLFLLQHPPRSSRWRWRGKHCWAERVGEGEPLLWGCSEECYAYVGSPLFPSFPTACPLPPPAPPQVQQVAVEGEALLGGVLRARGSYFGGAEGASLLQWFREEGGEAEGGGEESGEEERGEGNGVTGAGRGRVRLVPVGEGREYSVQADDVGCHLLLHYTPVASSGDACYSHNRLECA